MTDRETNLHWQVCKLAITANLKRWPLRILEVHIVFLLEVLDNSHCVPLVIYREPNEKRKIIQSLITRYKTIHTK